MTIMTTGRFDWSGTKMARYTGAVRFKDGEVRYFVYDGTVDMARRALYASPDLAEQARHQPMLNDKSEVAHDDVAVEVMPYYCHGGDGIAFASHADAARTRLTGARSLEEATRQQ